MKRYGIVLAGVVSILIGCTQLTANMSYLNDLRDPLVRKYNAEDIGLEITNNQILTVSFVNSKFNSLDAEAKQKISEEINTIVMLPIKDRLFTNNKYGYNKKITDILFWIS